MNVKLVRIDYWLERAEIGIHFADGLLYTDNQIRRAHCWFPCMDNIEQRCSFDMEFTVNTNYVVVSNGSLLYQANCAVCRADVSGATALSSSAASSDLYGTQTIGIYGKICSWKAVAVLQMLEKQMGPDSFRKGLITYVDAIDRLIRCKTSFLLFCL